MAVRVLVVDDSGFFRRRVTTLLQQDPRIEVVGEAVDGRDAVQKAQRLKPDVITMDIEMPVMDGISAVRRIMEVQPTPVLMFSSLTRAGAQATFDALDAGAVDYLAKNFGDLASSSDKAAQQLRSRVWGIGIRGLPRPAPRPAPQPAPPPRRVTALRPARSLHGNYKLVAIGSSTGGPVALQTVLRELPADFAAPIVLVQHMPGSFTEAFAKRLDQLCAIEVREARDGDELHGGLALLAPGGKQLLVEARGGLRVRVQDSEPGQNYKPCVDLTYTSIAKAAPGACLAIVLTGMGADGREGARALKETGATVWAQDEASSVIAGMPVAVSKAGLADRVLALSEVGPQLVDAV